MNGSESMGSVMNGSLMSERRVRIKEIDTLRGLLIILTVIGHSYDTGFSHYHLLRWEDYIYLFHMPCFFMLSGMLVRINDSDNNYNGCRSRDNIISKARRLILPYYIFLGIVGGGTILTRLILLEDISDILNIKAVAKILLGSLGNLNIGPIWFLPVLFLSEIGFIWLMQLRTPLSPHSLLLTDKRERQDSKTTVADADITRGVIIKVCILTAIWCLGHFMAMNFHFFYPWRVSIVTVGIVYCAVGYVFAHYFKDSILLLLMSVFVILVYIIGKFTFGYFGTYGLELAIDWYHDYILDFIIPTSCFVVLFWLCRALTPIKFITTPLSDIGKYTLTILGLHIPIRNIMLYFGVNQQIAIIIVGTVLPYILGKYLFRKNKYLKVLA